MSDNIHTQGAREALMRGIKKAADTIAGTLGPTGYSLIVEEELYPGSRIVDDGWLALKRIKLEDPLEQRGVELLKEAVEKANKESGDGSTTTTILTSKILEEGLKTNLHGKDIKQSLDECLPVIEKSIETQTVQITPSEVGKVATISANDEKIGTLLQEIYEKVGKDGVVELDLSKTPDTFYDIVDGIRLQGCGFLHPLMANNQDRSKATYENPYILITKQKISTMGDIDPLLQKLSSGITRELVIFYDEIDPAIIETMAMSHNQGIFKFCLIKAPTLWKDWLFEDFAEITGAIVVDSSTGHPFKKLELGWLGTCDKLIASKDQTLVFTKRDFSAHLEKLKELGKEDDQQLLRLSWLQTKTAILKIGAQSESELSYKREKIQDARNAAYQALQSGVVVGAGKALVNASKDLPDTIGGEILKEALQAPYRQLQDNFGVSRETELSTESVFDPAMIPKNAIKNAISIAGTILTSNGVITLVK